VLDIPITVRDLADLMIGIMLGFVGTLIILAYLRRND